MAWTTQILDRITQVEPVEWDRLVQGHSFADRRWLETTEAVLVNHQPRYLLLRRDGKLCAGMVCTLQGHFQSPTLQRSLGGYIRRFPGLRCGVPISYDPSLFFCDDIQSADLLPALIEALETLLRQEHVSFYTIDHLAEEEAAWAFFRSRGYHRIDHLAEVYLDIQWASFEEYRASLSRKKRGEYSRIKNRLEREGVTLGVADLEQEDKGVLERLVNNVFQRHQEPSMYHRDLFIRARDLLGEDFRLVVARQAGQTIGCAALLHSGGEWVAKWPGLDYERALNTGTYYGLLAECVKQVIEAGGKRFRLGATAYQTKQHFGVTVEERIGALAFCNPLVHYVGGKALKVADRFGVSWPISEAKKDKLERMERKESAA